jgi:molybdate transport system ATP-binding protein
VEGALNGLVADFEVTRSEGFHLEVEISVPAGRTVALLGPNGAGKSTMVASLAGLLPIDTGTIELDGRVLDAPSSEVFIPAAERKVGVVFQDYLLFDTMTVLDNVAFGMRSRGMSRDEANTSARAWIGRLGLGDLEGRRPRSLSGGQAQRVALARALAIEPDLLILDEPLSALDVASRSQLRRELMGYLDAFPGPRILITHDPVEAFLVADEIHVVEGGRITQVGEPDDIRLRPRTRYIADLAGSNLYPGTAAGGIVTVGDHRLEVADSSVEGSVLVTIHPNAVSVFKERPEGSPRNVWITRVQLVEDLGERVRLLTSDPLHLTVEISEHASEELGLRPGSEVWLSLKATEVGVQPDPAND